VVREGRRARLHDRRLPLLQRSPGSPLMIARRFSFSSSNRNLFANPAQNSTRQISHALIHLVLVE
jgi:hypothetical protein